MNIPVYMAYKDRETSDISIQCAYCKFMVDVKCPPSTNPLPATLKPVAEKLLALVEHQRDNHAVKSWPPIQTDDILLPVIREGLIREALKIQEAVS